jgi:hypothetical protein
MLRDEARTAHRIHAIGHQLRYRIAWIYPATEPNRQINARSAEIDRTRIRDQLQLDFRMLGVKTPKARDAAEYDYSSDWTLLAGLSPEPKPPNVNFGR